MSLPRLYLVNRSYQAGPNKMLRTLLIYSLLLNQYTQFSAEYKQESSNKYHLFPAENLPTFSVKFEKNVTKKPHTITLAESQGKLKHTYGVPHGDDTAMTSTAEQ